MTIQERVLTALETTCAWREHLWHEHGRRDAPPLVAWLLDGQEEYEMAPGVQLHQLYMDAGGHEADDMASVVYSMMIHVSQRSDFTRIKEVVTVLDSYGAPPNYHTNDLNHDFETNPNTEVREQVTVMVSADDLVGGVESAVGLRSYTVTDGGQWVWGDTAIVEPELTNVDHDIIGAMEWGVLHAHA